MDSCKRWHESTALRAHVVRICINTLVADIRDARVSMFNTDVFVECICSLFRFFFFFSRMSKFPLRVKGWSDTRVVGAPLWALWMSERIYSILLGLSVIISDDLGIRDGYSNLYCIRKIWDELILYFVILSERCWWRPKFFWLILVDSKIY